MEPQRKEKKRGERRLILSSTVSLVSSILERAQPVLPSFQGPAVSMACKNIPCAKIITINIPESGILLELSLKDEDGVVECWSTCQPSYSFFRSRTA